MPFLNQLLASSIDFFIQYPIPAASAGQRSPPKLIQKLRLAWQCEVLVDLSEPLYPKPLPNR